MKINKRTLIYRTQMTEGWAEPTEEGAIYLDDVNNNDKAGLALYARERGI